MINDWIARRCYGTGDATVPGDACTVSRTDVFDAPIALLCQFVAVGVDVVVGGINGCTHDDVVDCCRRSLILILLLI